MNGLEIIDLGLRTSTKDKPQFQTLQVDLNIKQGMLNLDMQGITQRLAIGPEVAELHLRSPSTTHT